MPAGLKERAQALVEADWYNTQSDIHREGIRDLMAKYDFSEDSPQRRPVQPTNEGHTMTVIDKAVGGNGTPETIKSRIFSLRSKFNDKGQVIVYDAGGMLSPDNLPKGVEYMKTPADLEDALS